MICYLCEDSYYCPVHDVEMYSKIPEDNSANLQYANEQPEIEWIPLNNSRTGFKAVHKDREAPCIFIDNQCSCGILNIGIIEEIGFGDNRP